MVPYDGISDHPQLVFDGRNILKLHVDCVYILKDMIFIFGRFGLKLLIHARFGEFFLWGGYYPQINSDIVATPQPSLGENTSYEP